MIVAGLMSGTSSDGVDVAIVRLEGRGFQTRVKLLQHRAFTYERPVRRAVLSAMNARAARVANLARLNFLLAEVYADAIRATVADAGVRVELIGCHGQTIYHQGESRPFLGRDIACTWQTGEGAILAARTGAPVVSDFRPADMAVLGTGAPLVPFLDYLLYRHPRHGRIVQNIGGIANLTAIPPGASPEQVIAFDTGPGNMVMDALAERLFAKPFDRDGHLAARGEINQRLLAQMLRHPFFRRQPPKTAGREEFGREYLVKLLRQAKGVKKEDLLATATALTARSIAAAATMFLGAGGGLGQQIFREFIVSGGGARNRTLMAMLREQLPGVKLHTSDDFGLPSEAKEAVAFAVLAYQTWHRLPSNIPAATGAERAAVLGKISYP
ncbi:MAG: anhydro-N-acetylmuramic acid kinase [Terriglobales bacterium]